MRDAWAVFRIGEIAEVFDGPHATPTKTQAGPWFLSISSLNNGRINLSQSAHLSEEDFVKWTRRVRPLPGDTLFSYETRLGEAAYWSLDCDAALGRRMGLLRPKPAVDPRFLTYAYLGPQFQTEIRKRAIHGATVDRIPIAELPSWEIALPPLDEQRRIAGVLGALDDLIEVNLGLISHLVQLSEAVILGSLGEQSEPLSQVATVHRGTGYKSSDFADDGGKLCVGMGACSQTGLLKQEKIRRIGREISEKYVAQPFDIIMSNVDLTWDFGILAWPIVVPNEFEDGLVFTSDIYALRMKEESNLPSVALWAQLRSDRFRQLVQGCARGTTVASISRDDILSFPIKDQESPEATLFAGAALRLAWALTRENGQIAETRDELLPLLMSGRVRVRADGVAA